MFFRMTCEKNLDFIQQKSFRLKWRRTVLLLVSDSWYKNPSRDTRRRNYFSRRRFWKTWRRLGCLLSVYIMVYMHFLLVLLQTEGLLQISDTRATRGVTSWYIECNGLQEPCNLPYTSVIIGSFLIWLTSQLGGRWQERWQESCNHLSIVLQ